MSSFVIDKEEYIKAAGLCYGFEVVKREPHRYYLERIYDMFDRLYKLNVFAYKQQYREHVLIDDKIYSEVFHKYINEGKRYSNAVQCEKIKFGIWHFLNSVEYQIEDDELGNEASALMFSIVSHLFSNRINNSEE